MSNELSPRDQAYLDIIHHGLVMLRESAAGGRIDLCRIEAEQLHEIPTMIGDSNSARHAYYLRATRDLYLQQLQSSGDATYLEQARIWYGQPWRTLEDVAAAAPSAV